jgi:hypothetical protein
VTVELDEHGVEIRAAFALVSKRIPERIEGELLVILDSDYKEFHELLKTPYLKCEAVDGCSAFVISRADLPSIQDAMKIGPRTLSRVLGEIGQKSVSSPGTLFSVHDNRVSLPSNLESAADSLVHKFIILFNRLSIKSEFTDQQISIPEFSQGWTTNVSNILNIYLKIVANFSVEPAKREQLPAKMKTAVGRQILSLIVFKWASRKNLVTYLNSETKKLGNISEISFIDVVRGWGTSCQGNLAQRLASSIYQLSGIISHNSLIDEMMNRAYFASGSDLRKSIAPPRQVVEKVGKTIKVVKRGEVNVLRFDNIRFLLPSERGLAKAKNESSDFEDKIKEFDHLPVKDRNYPQMVELLREGITENGKIYFKLRRLAKERLYAIKEVRREAKQPDQIPDSEFANNEFVSSVIKQAEALILDIDRRGSIIERLRMDPISSAFRPQKDLEEEEAEHQ